jgi:hypothetical protein
MVAKPTNVQLADLLEQIAEEVEVQDDNPFRVRAYRDGAQTIRDTEESVADLALQGGDEALQALPHIGEGIASVLREYVQTGKSVLLDDLRSNDSPIAVFARVPGIGRELAQRIVDTLHIKTLPELEVAAHNGRLAEVEGFGPRRVEAMKVALAGMLSHSALRRTASSPSKTPKSDAASRPSVELLLKIDADYRERAKAGDFSKIAPRRFNPTHVAWLPVLRTQQSGWKFTALFSNTAQAHELEKTDDWVVIYYEKDGQQRQNTVVTETQGDLQGKRVVRGRSREVEQYYKAKA